MESRPDSHHTDISLSEGAPLVPRDGKDVPDTLSKLADEAARATATLRPATADFSAGPRPTAGEGPDVVVALDSALAPERPRHAGAGLARFVLAAGIGVAATLAWQSYGQAARQLLAVHVPALAATVAGSPPAAPEPEQARPAAPTVAAAASPDAPASAASLPAHPDLTPQIEAMARDLAALRESMAKLVAAQDEAAKSLAKLRTEDEAKPTPNPTPKPAVKPVPKPRPTAVRRAPPPAAAPSPVARAVPPSSVVTSAPLSVVPPPAAVTELPRRPPAGLP
jgi:hypothetical protein